MNSSSIRQPGSRAQRNGGPSQATISALITFVEWSQGCVSLEIALEQVIAADGSQGRQTSQNLDGNGQNACCS